jgi:hypothetical protein
VLVIAGEKVTTGSNNFALLENTLILRIRLFFDRTSSVDLLLVSAG